LQQYYLHSGAIVVQIYEPKTVTHSSLMVCDVMIICDIHNKTQTQINGICTNILRLKRFSCILILSWGNCQEKTIIFRDIRDFHIMSKPLHLSPVYSTPPPYPRAARRFKTYPRLSKEEEAIVDHLAYLHFLRINQTSWCPNFSQEA
jgi:hypothetical protein